MNDMSAEAAHPALRLEVAHLIVDALVLEDVEAAGIDPQAPLFGEGLELDSIDALELAFAVAKRYGFELRSDDRRNGEIFASLDALTRHIAANRTQ